MSENTNTYPAAALRMAHQNGVSEGRVEMAAEVRPVLDALHSTCDALFGDTDPSDPDDPQLVAMKNAAELLYRLPSDAVFGVVPPTEPATDEDIAELFHTTYERLAPAHGYKTREASAVPWMDVPENNRTLMIAVAREVRAALFGAPNA